MACSNAYTGAGARWLDVLKHPIGGLHLSKRKTLIGCLAASQQRWLPQCFGHFSTVPLSTIAQLRSSPPGSEQNAALRP
jgi:hypothetical protein